ncbi:MAG: CHASE domain-containing protein, partial [Rhizobiales bacterium]|nr:CHASE domain-containing protein [Rhizobacter sp.]
MATDTPSDKPLHWAAAFALTALCYALAGIAALPLAIPPGYSTPLYPAAGVALASVLIFGTRMLPAVLLGSLGVNISLALQSRPFGAGMLVVPLAIAFGAMLQAWVGAVLVKRHVQQPLTLSEPRDIAAFLIVGMVSCLVNAVIANFVLWSVGTVPTADLPFSASTWWIGDLLGVLIAVPIILTLLGSPREAWVPRRMTVGFTLALVTVLLASGIWQVVQWNAERVQSAFKHDATSAAQALAAQLREPLQALEALHGVFVASAEVTREEMRLASRTWLESGTLQAMGWSERVARGDLPAFEARERAAGVAGYSVFDRRDSSQPADPADEVLAMRYIEPATGNADALGVNVWSIPAARVATQIARRTGLPAATAGFRLTQQTGGAEQTGVVIYRALYAPSAPSAAEREAALRGVVFVTLRMEDQL